jgi:hypothetical protein
MRVSLIGYVTYCFFRKAESSNNKYENHESTGRWLKRFSSPFLTLMKLMGTASASASASALGQLENQFYRGMVMRFLRRLNRLAFGGAIATAALILPASAYAANCVNGINAATCTVPAGVTSVFIEAWGAGGGGDAGAAAGGGGGGGSYCAGTFAATPLATLTVTTGTGGAAGTGLGGGSGAASVVTGPGISVTANGGSPGFQFAGGLGGTVAGCTAATSHAGGNGSGPIVFDGGGGGGSATPTSAGTNAIGSTAGTGTGNGGNGGIFGPPAMLSAAGSAPGGGGGGAATGSVSAAGAAGQVKMIFTVSVASVPTLSEYGLMALAALLAAFGFRQVRRRHS